MLIGIDAQTANKKERTGVEWYAYYIIQFLKNQPLQNHQVVLYSSSLLLEDLHKLPEGWESKILRWPFKRGWLQGRLSMEMWQHPPNILFVPGQRLPHVVPHIIEKKQATVTMIHDISFKRYPDLFSPSDCRRLEQATNIALQKATRILVPSIFTKKELIDVYKVKEERLVVTPLAVDTSKFCILEQDQIRHILDQYRLGKKNYFLTIGRIEKKKNSLMLIQAFEQFKRDRGFGDPFKLIFAGSKGEGFNEIKQVVDLSPHKDDIQFLGWIPQDDLPGLINGAAAYLFPSWYEGFGLPNLEALACGTPLLTSDIAPHREVVQDAALFVSPHKPELWTKAMREIIENQALQQDLIQKGLKVVQGYSWQKTAEITARVFLDLF
ncbi:hypothetical protein CO172_03145 [Candidatus Uhrbacteria bacterium CG_4_9_14_3_um_filter_36_7]|uniref:Glycosyl transferase family 1 domain-containing protein n=1 Tax=Candidatus Uhrbacteria bacterium CG_4_9_14_3_um_filter_36_7 TaxID=1975033 RepID=A0A2M7XGP2_9BACT|nr:MAG: hypothetical protein CO172_03145 [Candidatus Uhrbacteria bacterium CG_4_9_14_3_um_filter_36_7]